MPKTDFKSKKRYIIGIDEAGRGPLAGPVSVAAVAISEAHYAAVLAEFSEAKDSKQLSPHVRAEIFSKLKKEKDILYAVTLVGSRTIDRRGIVHAVRTALSSSLKKLAIHPLQSTVLLDGSLSAPKEYVDQKTIIRGDQIERVISLASIVAKVHRDRHMVRKSKKYSEYDFEIHKGYGTAAHIKKIKKHGPSKIHRRSFLKSL